VESFLHVEVCWTWKRFCGEGGRWVRVEGHRWVAEGGYRVCSINVGLSVLSAGCTSEMHNGKKS
jgi:hypothetical protein